MKRKKIKYALQLLYEEKVKLKEDIKYGFVKDESLKLWQKMVDNIDKEIEMFEKYNEEIRNG